MPNKHSAIMFRIMDGAHAYVKFRDVISKTTKTQLLPQLGSNPDTTIQAASRALRGQYWRVTISKNLGKQSRFFFT